MKYVNILNTGDNDFDQFMLRSFVSAAKLSYIVKRAISKGYCKHDTVNAYKVICRKYGYSGMPEKQPNTRPYGNWSTLENGLQYCDESKLYWDGSRVYDETSANHNGIVGAGADLRNMLNS